MKISVSSYSFNRYIKGGKMKQFDAVEKAHSIGVPNIEFTELMPDEGVSREQYAKDLRSEAAKYGMDITCYAIGASMVMESRDDEMKEIERLKAEVDIAKLLGVPVMRHDAFFQLPSRFKTFDQALPFAAENIREVTCYAQKLGIKTTIENHGFICQDSARVEKIVTAVAHENFGLLVDMGNFMCVDENPALAVSRCAPYAFHVHAKDFHFKPYSPTVEEGYFRSRGCNLLCGSVIGEGAVPVSQCIAILKKSGYDGTLGIEFEGREDCIEGIKKGYENLKRFVEEAVL